MSIPLTIFLVDDDTVDRDLFREALSDIGLPFTLEEDENGESFLQRMESTEILPDVIFLDFNMPVKDGRATLKELKAHSVFSKIPVFILSTSNSQFDMSLAYEEGAGLFLVKPHSYPDLVAMLQQITNVFVKFTPYASNRRVNNLKR